MKKLPSSRQSPPKKITKKKAKHSSKDIPDLRLIEAMFQEMIGKEGFSANSSEMFLNEALDEENPEKRAALVREALAANPDNVDAYLLVAENEPFISKQLAFYEQAVRVGERVLGPETFQNAKGQYGAEIPAGWCRTIAASDIKFYLAFGVDSRVTCNNLG